MTKTKTQAPPVDIAQLLADSAAAHLQYRAHSPHMTGVGGQLVPVSGDPVLARAALERAAALRKQAHDADPAYTDPAWDQDTHGAVHTALMTFYAEQLAK